MYIQWKKKENMVYKDEHCKIATKNDDLYYVNYIN